MPVSQAEPQRRPKTGIDFPRDHGHNECGHEHKKREIYPALLRAPVDHISSQNREYESEQKSQRHLTLHTHVDSDSYNKLGLEIQENSLCAGEDKHNWETLGFTIPSSTAASRSPTLSRASLLSFSLHIRSLCAGQDLHLHALNGHKPLKLASLLFLHPRNDVNIPTFVQEYQFQRQPAPLPSRQLSLFRIHSPSNACGAAGGALRARLSHGCSRVSRDGPERASQFRCDRS